MKKSKMKNQLWTALAVGLAAMGAQATILQNWQFNDAAGTSIKNAANTAGTYSFNANTAFVMNGSGQAVRTGQAAANTAFSPALSSPITNGSVYFRVDFSSWSLQSAITPSYTVGFLSTAGKYITVGLSEKTSALANVYTDNSNGGFANPSITPSSGLALTDSTPISLILGVNLGDGTNGSFSVWRKIGSATNYTQVVATKQFAAAFADIANLRLGVNDGGVTGNTVAMDMMVVGTNLTEIQTIPEPATMGMIGLAAGVLFFIRRRLI